MSTLVFTARVATRDPDAFDITRATAHAAMKAGRPAPGEPFAPSWTILNPALAALDEALVMLGKAKAQPQHRTWYERRALDIADAGWFTYVPKYQQEMLDSYRYDKPAWDRLLARRRVVLVCTCVDGERCHRRLLAGLLREMGAVDGGELVEVSKQVELFGGR